VRRRDPALAPRLSTLIAYPLYLVFLDVCFCWGHWRSVLWYSPWWPLQRGMAAKWAADHRKLFCADDAAAVLLHASSTVFLP
jgi:hypothetical protein